MLGEVEAEERERDASGQVYMTAAELMAAEVRKRGGEGRGWAGRAAQGARAGSEGVRAGAGPGGAEVMVRGWGGAASAGEVQRARHGGVWATQGAGDGREAAVCCRQGVCQQPFSCVWPPPF